MSSSNHPPVNTRSELSDTVSRLVPGCSDLDGDMHWGCINLQLIFQEVRCGTRKANSSRGLGRLSQHSRLGKQWGEENPVTIKTDATRV